MTHKLRKGELLNEMELDVVNHQEIPSLLPIQIVSGIRRKKFRFRMNSAVPLLSYIQSDISFAEFLRLVQQIIDVMQSCEAHGIRAANLELNPQYLFYDYVSREVRLLYWPLLSLEEPASGERLFQWLGGVYAPTQRDRRFINEYMEYFDQREEFSLFHFERAIRSLRHDWNEAQRTDRSAQDWEHRAEQERQAAHMSGGVTAPTLLQLSTNTKIELRTFPFIIGRSPELCQYAIDGNTYVGRQHLTLNCRGGRVYAVDMNSLNGSMLDGEALAPGQERELRSGCKLTLGDEEFIFFAPNVP